MSRYAVILAGGSGTRLWPLSRRKAPKQVRALLDDATLLQKTYRRVRQQFAADAVYVSTLAEHAAEVGRQLSEIAADHIIAEPIGRDTAAAIGYAAVRLIARDPDATFVTINSDAYVADDDAYHRAIAITFDAAEQSEDGIALVGIAPQYPETGYGYIELQQNKDKNEGMMVVIADAIRSGRTLPVCRFVEKPDMETAARYVASGRHLWNPALFVFRAQKLLTLFSHHLPQHAAALAEIASARDAATITRAFLTMPTISIDYGIMEKLERLVVVPASFGWADVGHWRAVHAILSGERGTSADVARGAHVGLNGNGNLVVAPDGKLVVTCGIENCVIIDTPDALLICPRDRAQDVKEVVKELERRGMTQYL